MQDPRALLGGKISQAAGIRAVAAADYDHQVHALGQVDGFSLVVTGGLTYGVGGTDDPCLVLDDLDRTREGVIVLGGLRDDAHPREFRQALSLFFVSYHEAAVRRIAAQTHYFSVVVVTHDLALAEPDTVPFGDSPPAVGACADAAGADDPLGADDPRVPAACASGTNAATTRLDQRTT